jgi:hypothetical protein
MSACPVLSQTFETSRTVQKQLQERGGGDIEGTKQTRLRTYIYILCMYL